MKHKTCLIIMLCFFLFSCAAQNNYRQICESWVGHDINELIRAWGYPQRTNTMPNGNTMYTYYKSNTRTESDPVLLLPSKGMSMAVGGDTTTYTNFCETSIETSRSGNILFISWRGNICR